MTEVHVIRDIDAAIRLFTKRVQASGILREVRERRAFIPRSERRRMAARKGRQRWLEKLRGIERR